MKIFEIVVEHKVKSSVLGRADTQEEIEAHMPELLAQMTEGRLIEIKERPDIPADLVKTPEDAEALVADEITDTKEGTVH